MAKKKSIEKLHEIVGGEMGFLTDFSASWVKVEDDEFSLEFVFDGQGKKLEKIYISKKTIIKTVDEKILATIKAKQTD